VLEQDVLGAQVAVAVADAAARGSCLELGATRREEGLREASERADLAGELGVGRRCEQRVDVLGERRVERGRRVSTLGDVGLGVEVGEAAADRGQRGVVLAAVRDVCREGARLVEPPHLHHMVDRIGCAGGGELHALRGRDDGPRAEVDVGREPAVEAHLLLAHRAPSVRGSVVDERQHDRLLELVRALAHEEDARDVGLAQLDRPGIDAVGLRARERGGESGPRRSRSMGGGLHGLDARTVGRGSRPQASADASVVSRNSLRVTTASPARADR
jgi:hypothetical protein